jgi:hypothetical protein
VRDVYDEEKGHHEDHPSYSSVKGGNQFYMTLLERVNGEVKPRPRRLTLALLLLA